MRFGHRLTRGPHPRQASPNRALLANLVRLEAVEVAKSDAFRFNHDGAGRKRRLVELEAPRRAHDDSVETLVVTSGAPTRPHVRGSKIRALADGIGTYLASRLNAPRVFVRPHLLIGQLEAPPILGLQTRGTRTSVSAIAKHGQLIRPDSEFAHDFF